MTSASTWPLLALDLLGVFVFGLSGGLVAVRKRFDGLSVLILAAAAGLGGGVLRDVLIGAVPPVGVSDWQLVAAACAAGLLTFFFTRGCPASSPPFCSWTPPASGCSPSPGRSSPRARHCRAHRRHVGVLAGVGGGVLRDLLAGDPPRLLAEREWYATPALIGAPAYAAAWTVDAAGPLTAAGCVVLITVLRILGLRRGWQVPAPPAPDT